MDKVSPIRQEPATATIVVTRSTAPILFELCAKAAIAGAQAHLLADLYAQAEAAARQLASET